MSEDHELAWKAMCEGIEEMDTQMLHMVNQSSEWTQLYVVPTGPWHRLLGMARRKASDVASDYLARQAPF